MICKIRLDLIWMKVLEFFRLGLVWWYADESVGLGFVWLGFLGIYWWKFWVMFHRFVSVSLNIRFKNLCKLYVKKVSIRISRMWIIRLRVRFMWIDFLWINLESLCKFTCKLFRLFWAFELKRINNNNAS